MERIRLKIIFSGGTAILIDKPLVNVEAIAVIGIRVFIISIVIIILFLIDILQPRFFIQRF